MVSTTPRASPRSAAIISSIPSSRRICCSRASGVGPAVCVPASADFAPGSGAVGSLALLTTWRNRDTEADLGRCSREADALLTGRADAGRQPASVGTWLSSAWPDTPGHCAPIFGKNDPRSFRSALRGRREDGLRNRDARSRRSHAAPKVEASDRAGAATCGNAANWQTAISIE